jgi:hypothetical protein
MICKDYFQQPVNTQAIKPMLNYDLQMNTQNVKASVINCYYINLQYNIKSAVNQFQTDHPGNYEDKTSHNKSPVDNQDSAYQKQAYKGR